MRGRHLTIDGWSDPDRAYVLLNDHNVIAHLLVEVVARVGMAVLRPPEIVRVRHNTDAMGTDRDEGGLTGTVLLTTSHASLHTWPLTGRFSFDLFSCRDFDPLVVFAYLEEALRMTGGVVHCVERTHDDELRDRVVWR